MFPFDALEEMTAPTSEEFILLRLGTNRFDITLNI